MSYEDVYSRLTSNVSQSIFSIIIGSMFSALILLLFSKDSIILFIFEIPLAFLLAVITMSECLYEYRDEISLDKTVKMIGPLIKMLFVSIPIVFLYSSIIIILQALITPFRLALESFIDTHVQALRQVIIAVPVIFYMPALIMMTTMPLLLYGYGKFFMLIFGVSKIKKKEKASMLAEKSKIIYQEKINTILAQLDNDLTRMKQYLLELQVLPNEISRVDSHELYKGLKTRLEMMIDYVNSVGVIDKEDKKVAGSSEDVQATLKEIAIEKKAVIEQAQNYLKVLQKEKAMYKAPPKEGEEEEEEEEEEENNTKQRKESSNKED